jgi:hypothetical protein
MSPIIEHPDVRRMLLTMRALTAASRAICLKTADAIDRAKLLPDALDRAAALEEAGLLTPVAKAFSSDNGIEVASLGIQVHGGMGYIEETGAAQHYRDARIAAIYEGTNGIQALDLVTRKIGQSDGAVLKRMIGSYRATAERVEETKDEAFGATAFCLGEAVDALERSSEHLLRALKDRPPDALAEATPYLRLFGLAAGGCYLAKAALASRLLGASAAAATPARVGIARFFAENIAPATSGLERAVVCGAGSVLDADATLGA